MSAEFGTDHAHDGRCPRCASEDMEREVIYLTTSRAVGGVVFFCGTCGFTAKALSTDREAWFDVHKAWHSPAVIDATFEAFCQRWSKRVGHGWTGDPEPLGPTLPGPAHLPAGHLPEST